MSSVVKHLAPSLEQLREVSALLWEKGWAERNAGNLSIDVTEAAGRAFAGMDGRGSKLERPSGYPHMSGRLLLVTGTGCRFREISRDPFCGACLVQITPNGRSYVQPNLWKEFASFTPTSELPTHLLIHDFLRSIGASEKVVLHTHPTELIALSHFEEFHDRSRLNRALWGTMPEVKVVVPSGTGIVPYMLPGSEELAVATVEEIESGHTAVLWAMHGCLAIGETAVDAFDTIDTLNKGAQVLLHCLSAGRRPTGLSDGDLEELKTKFNLKS